MTPDKGNWRSPIEDHYRKLLAARMARDEQLIRSLLERWVSELEPAIAYRNGEIIGLTPANAPLGSKPFILRVLSCT